MRGHRCAMKDLLIALLDTPGEANPRVDPKGAPSDWSGDS